MGITLPPCYRFSGLAQEKELRCCTDKDIDRRDMVLMQNNSTNSAGNMSMREKRERKKVIV